MHGLELLEALLDHGLALVRLKHLRRRQGSIVGDQRVHPITDVVVGNGGFVDRPLDIEAPLCELAISGVGPGTTAPSLLVQMLFAHDAADFEITSDMMVMENGFDLQI